MLGSEKLSLISLEDQTLFSVLQSKSIIKPRFSGYIEAEFEHEVNSSDLEKWYLFFAEGKIVFSHSQKIEFSNILSSLQNYLPSLRRNSPSNSNKINDLVNRAREDNSLSIKKYLEKLALINERIDYERIISAIQLHITVNSEKYLFKNIKSVSLVEDLEIDRLQPISGFEIDDFLETIKSRKNQWKSIKDIIPSLDCSVRENEDPTKWSKVSEENKQRIRTLLSYGNTLEEIRYKLGEDTLKTSQLFSNLIQNKLLTIEEKNPKKLDRYADLGNLIPDSAQEVFLIDDSPILLKQVNQIITALGYKTSCCENALEAVDKILESDAKAIFIDINMPEISGFELMRDIRVEPKLKSIPIVILTGEKTIMNQQRAKWLKCEFLIKPLSPGDKLRFLSDIKSTLTKLVPN